MTDIWNVIVEDRHVDVDALPFSTEEAATRYAREQAVANARHPEYIQETDLTEGMRKDGWVLCIGYSTESDYVRVVRRTLDATP